MTSAMEAKAFDPKDILLWLKSTTNTKMPDIEIAAPARGRESLCSKMTSLMGMMDDSIERAMKNQSTPAPASMPQAFCDLRERKKTQAAETNMDNRKIKEAMTAGSKKLRDT